jgi:hypothetical protein
MQTPIILAAALPDLGTIILIVLAAALLPAAYRLCGLLAEINKTLAKSANPSPQAPAPSPPKQPSPAPQQPSPTPAAHDDGIAPEIIALIAAAVATAIGKSHRIISIKPMSTSWERAGRQSVLTSHRIR